VALLTAPPRQTEPPLTAGGVAAYLERIERRQEEQAKRIKQLEADVQEARRDKLADLVRLPTFLARYDVKEVTLRWWLAQRHRNGAAVWVRQGSARSAIWIDLAKFHQWFETRFSRPAPVNVKGKARG
jgi:hypothetical protein